MKPFLLLATRADEAAADGEYEAFLRFGSLPADSLVRVRLESGPLPALDLSDYSGVLVGGSPFNASDPVEQKSTVQLRVEAELSALLDRIVAADIPFLGACYGVGTLGRHQGAVIGRRFGEPIGPVQVTLTDEGLHDPLLAGLPSKFQAFVGHKEACTELPAHATLLASSAGCPVQMFRIKSNLYATQFHPELDVAGLLTRIDVYRDAGYFHPDQLEQVRSAARAENVDQPAQIIANFVRRYARS
ncbi:glutamine amidotransferase [Paenarthrobacter sp. PH39-S1]|uniref:glutamine amidotransferase n=1 Tax=Paenarthrobacter sp. PH39-S1 TaxID=3046204 RepID=UPI0024BA18D3|nr:glutamine amidotransferase [Paenarthrobacter sp. PH39-S1]MDJ0357641.1 glutamine amidotransferase [Paenarthrobacter sp. PH39-S1]